MGRRKKRDEDALKSKEVITVGFVECTCGLKAALAGEGGDRE